jgi:LAO/AO transport system kinase
VPEAGDAVQVMKAGLLEIADVFLVNKADREGAERMRLELVQMLHLRPESGWAIPVLATQAAADVGIEAVLEAVEQHRSFLASDTDRVRRDRVRREGELLDILDEELRRRLERGLGRAADGLGPLLEAVRGGDVDPYTAALRILEDAPTLEGLLGR